MIFTTDPMNWQDLQKKVGQVFNEMGCFAEVEKRVETVRGTVSIDVYVVDRTNRPELTYLCECKYWNASIPQSVVHSFQTVVSNTGANCGYIISRKGFQAGSFNAVDNTNILPSREHLTI